MNIIVMVLLIFLSISIAVGVMIDTLTRRSKHESKILWITLLVVIILCLYMENQ